MFDQHHSLIVLLLLVDLGEFIDRLHNGIDGSFEGVSPGAAFLVDFGQTGNSVEFILFIGGFIDSVGEHQHGGLRSDLRADGIEFGEFTGEQPQRGAVGIDGAGVFAQVQQQGRVPRPRIFDRGLLLVDQTASERDIPFIHRIPVEILVQFPEQIFQRGEVPDIGADERTCHGHDHTGGNSFSARVADHHKQTVVVNLHEVVEVAADLLGRAGESMNDKPSPHREFLRHEGELQIPGERQFLIDPLLFAEIGIHLNDVLSEHHLGGDVVNGRSIRLLLTAQITPETCPSLTSGTAISV